MKQLRVLLFLTPEHEQNFKAENVELSIGKSKENRPLLAIGGMYYSEWFKEQKLKLLKSLGIKVSEPKRQMRQKR